MAQRPGKHNKVSEPTLRDDLSDLSSSESDGGGIEGKPKGKKKQPKRSSKACDNCRKSKCRCVRAKDEDGNEAVICNNCATTGVECTSLGATRKRGPPKGYIEAIESRLHRMEALLGGLLQSDDPRAAHLLTELIGDDEAREVLAGDLRAAAADPTQQTLKARAKSWHNPVQIGGNPFGVSSGPSTIVSQGFTPASGSFGDTTFTQFDPSQNQQPNFFTEDDLKFTTTPAGVGAGAGANLFGVDLNALGFDPSGSYRSRHDSSSDGAPSPALNFGIDIPLPASLSSTGTGSASAPVRHSSSKTRKLNNASASPALPLAPIGSGPAAFAGAAGAFRAPAEGKVLPANAVGHTGTASYSLSEDAELAQDGEDGDGPVSELADVTGQLSLNENAEVRYHGRSSGLYLISKSSRFKNFFWQFPNAPVWPPSDQRVVNTEKEILALTGTTDALPDRATQQHLLDLYFAYVHISYPVIYKVSWLQQYRRGLNQPDSTERSTPGGQGNVPSVLLLAMFALAARFADREVETGESFANRGQKYHDAAKKILFFDVGSSRIVNVQALLLLGWRELGAGAMSAAWLFSGMALRIAQDLGLHRSAERWFLPVQKFSHEEKEVRKRVWTAVLALDRHAAAYIGRPPGAHERDMDQVGMFPSTDEPDEHEQWKQLLVGETPEPVGMGAKAGGVGPATKSLTLSCFNAGASLAVLINRVIINVYAIRIRVLGQSSATLLSLLDQSLASWYLNLPATLQYSPASRKVPPPNVLTLHLTFYSTLILLHRPFIPAQGSTTSPATVPSHSICTTSAHAIANIVATYDAKYSLKQCMPSVIYPVFSAAIICVYNASCDDDLARPAKVHLATLMAALKSMESTWGSAQRQRELLLGLVDLRETQPSQPQSQSQTQPRPSPSVSPTEQPQGTVRGTKRAVEIPQPHANGAQLSPGGGFASAPLTRPVAPAGSRRRSSSAASSLSQAAAQAILAQQHHPTTSPTIYEHTPLNPSPYEPSPPTPAPPPQMTTTSLGMEFDPLPAPASWDLLGLGASGPGAGFDLEQYRAQHNAQTPIDFAQLLSSFAAETEQQYHSQVQSQGHGAGQGTFGLGGGTPGQDSGGGAGQAGGGFDGAFGGMPMGIATEEWQAFLPQSFSMEGLMGAGQSPSVGVERDSPGRDGAGTAAGLS